MLITRVSAMTGKKHTLDIPVTEDQVRAWQNGMLIQRAMPALTPDQREFFITGVTAEEWHDTFGDEE